MRQQVIRYECDSCHKTVDVRLDSIIKPGRVPEDWLHVDGFTNTQTVFKLDLCEECKQPIAQLTENASEG